MDARQAIGAASGISRIDALRSSDAPWQGTPKEQSHEGSVPEVEDRVSLSSELRIRQDVVRNTEEQRSANEQNEDTLGSGMGGQAASASERERVRELLLQDIETRMADATEGVDRTIRSLPSFEYDIGPYGRAYAVGDGVHLDPPASEPPESDAPAPSVIGKIGVGSDAEDAESAIQMLPSSDTEARDAAAPWQTTGRGRVESEPAESTEAAPVVQDDVEASGNAEQFGAPLPGERTARAYQSALGMVEAPGGLEGRNIDVLG